MTKMAGKLCTCNRYPVYLSSSTHASLYFHLCLLPQKRQRTFNVRINEFIGMLKESRMTSSVASPVGIAFLVCL
jgi:hypothetical protein